jgi:hypothetical protein
MITLVYYNNHGLRTDAIFSLVIMCEGKLMLSELRLVMDRL